MKSLLVALLLSVVVLLGTTVFLIAETNQLQEDVQELRGDVRPLQQVTDDVRQLQDDFEEADASTVDRSVVEFLRRRLNHVYDCVPEVQDQVNTLEVIGRYAYPSSNVSRFCSDFVYGEDF